MPSKNQPVVRTRYICPISGKPKFLQTNLSNHSCKKAAKEFLAEKKKMILSQNVKEVKEVKETGEVKEVEVTKEEIKDMSNINEVNLMDIPIESSPHIDKIYNELKYSPFKLNMNINEDGHSCTIFGSSKSGKSYLLERLLKKYVTKKAICILSAQNAHSKIYKNYPKDIIITDSYSPIFIKAGSRINKKSNNKYPMCFVLDDIIDKKSDRGLEDIYLTLRNSMCSIIVLLQNIQLLKSTSRSNSNILIFKKFNNPFAISEYVMKQYLGNYPPFKDLNMSDKVTLYMKIMNDGHYNFFILDVLENTLILCRGTDLK